MAMTPIWQQRRMFAEIADTGKLHIALHLNLLVGLTGGVILHSRLQDEGLQLTILNYHWAR